MGQHGIPLLICDDDPLLNDPSVGFASRFTHLNAFSRQRKAISGPDRVREPQLIPPESAHNGGAPHFMALMKQQGSDGHDMAAASSEAPVDRSLGRLLVDMVRLWIPPLRVLDYVVPRHSVLASLYLAAYLEVLKILHIHLLTPAWSSTLFSN